MQDPNVNRKNAVIKKNKTILVVGYDRAMLNARKEILQSAGYEALTTSNDDRMMRILRIKKIDLILLGQFVVPKGKPLQQRVRERYPQALILKMQPGSQEHDSFSNAFTAYDPAEMLEAIHRLLG